MSFIPLLFDVHEPLFRIESGQRSLTLVCASDTLARGTVVDRPGPTQRHKSVEFSTLSFLSGILDLTKIFFT